MNLLISLQILFISTFLCFIKTTALLHLLVFSFNLLPFRWCNMTCLRNCSILQLFLSLSHVFVKDIICWFLRGNTKREPLKVLHTLSAFWIKLSQSFFYLWWIARVQWEKFNACLHVYNLMQIHRKTCWSFFLIKLHSPLSCEFRKNFKNTIFNNTGRLFLENFAFNTLLLMGCLIHQTFIHNRCIIFNPVYKLKKIAHETSFSRVCWINLQRSVISKHRANH